MIEQRPTSRKTRPIEWNDTPRPAAAVEQYRKQIAEAGRMAERLRDELDRQKRAVWAARAVLVLVLAAAVFAGAVMLTTEMSSSIDRAREAQFKATARRGDVPPLTPDLHTLKAEPK